MVNENEVQTDINVENTKEVTLGKNKYSYYSDEEFDYLNRITDKGMTITLKFTKDKEKHKKAMEAIETFFSSL